MVAAGWVTSDAVDAALRRQPSSGRRLGALLVESGAVTVDDVARGLARQRGVPAALERHLQQRDPALATVLPAALAFAVGAIPVAWSRGAQGMSLVVCFRDPTPDHVAEVSGVVGAPVIPAVACELTLARELARTYPDRGGRADDEDSVDVNFDEPSAPMFSLVDLDDQRVQRDLSQAQLMPSRTGALLPPSQPPPVPPPRVAPAGPASPPVAPSLASTVAAIERAGERDAIAELALAYLRGVWRGAVLLVVREGLAVGHLGFGGQVTAAALSTLVIPLGQPSVFTTVADERRAIVGALPAGGLAQQRFLRLFDGPGPEPAMVAPVTVRGRVVNLWFAIGPRLPVPVASEAMTQLATAMGDGYERLIRAAKAK